MSTNEPYCKVLPLKQMSSQNSRDKIETAFLLRKNDLFVIEKSFRLEGVCSFRISAQTPGKLLSFQGKITMFFLLKKVYAKIHE